MDGSFLGQLGILLCFGGGVAGSALGIATAGMAAAGAWARDAKAGKPLKPIYTLFIGAPLSQTFYAMIVMFQMSTVLAKPEAAAMHGGLLFGIGLAVALGEWLSAWGQGMIGAAACRALSESEGKGLAFMIIAIGIVETVGIFSFVLVLGQIPKV